MPVSSAITKRVKDKIMRIVSVFETSSLDPKYDVLVTLKDGPVVKGERIKQITYGKHQTTEFSNLGALLKMYCNRPGALFAEEIKPYLPKVGKKETPLADNLVFKLILKKAGMDPVMHQVQDEFFEIHYWQPALKFFNDNKFMLPLSLAVIYDSYVHSGGVPSWLRNKYEERVPAKGGDEKKWVSEYVHTRDNWLENHTNKILRHTDYRTDCWIECIDKADWLLEMPVECKFNSSNQKHWVRIP